MPRSGRPSTAKAEYSNSIGPSTGWRRCLTPSPWLRDVVVVPHRREFGAERGTAPRPAARPRRRRRPAPRRPGTRRPRNGPRFPNRAARRGRGVAEDAAQDVALLRRQGAVVGQHRRVAARFQATTSQVAVLIIAGLGSSASSTRCSRGVTPSLAAVADLGRAAEAEQEQVLALDIGQHQRARDPVEHVGRGRAAAALFQPGVPGRADVGALRDLLAAQPRRAPAARRRSRTRRDRAGRAGPSDRRRAGSRRDGHLLILLAIIP